MNNEQDLLSELIDSCRNAEDLRSPELQPLLAAMEADSSVDCRFKKSQQIDSLVGRSVREVPVPLGLEQRLLSALAASKPNAESKDGTTSASSPVDSQDTADSQDTEPVAGALTVGSLERARSSGNRRWNPKSWKTLVGGLTTAAALAVLAFFAFSDTAPKLETEDQVAIEASHWIKNLKPQWSRSSFPEAIFPMPKMRLPNRYGWQQVSASHSSLQVVCYNLSSKAPTFLFVCHGSNPIQLPTKPSKSPKSVDSGWQIGSWKVGGLVYAIAVKGTPEQYRSLIQPGSRIASAVHVSANSS